VDNVDSIFGRTLIALDVSGSMTTAAGKTNLSFAQIGGIFAMALLRKNPDAQVMFFDTGKVNIRVNPRDTILSNVEKICSHSGGGTNLDIPFNEAIKQNSKYDNIIAITDSEEWAGEGIADQIRKYRSKVNPKVKVFLLRIDPYDTNPTPDMEGVYYIYGWSDLVLRYISSFTGSR
jgi:60 kDa SS-A/Ro ribonucleoprotein